MEDKPIMNILTPNEDGGVLRLLFLYTVIGWLANKLIKLYINQFLHGERGEKTKQNPFFFFWNLRGLPRLEASQDWQ